MRKLTKVAIGVSLATVMLASSNVFHKKADEHSDKVFRQIPNEHRYKSKNYLKHFEYDDFNEEKDKNIKFSYNDFDRRSNLIVKEGIDEYTFITKEGSLEIEYLELVSDGDDDIIEIYEVDELGEVHKKVFNDALCHIKEHNEIQDV